MSLFAHADIFLIHPGQSLDIFLAAECDLVRLVQQRPCVQIVSRFWSAHARHANRPTDLQHIVRYLLLAPRLIQDAVNMIFEPIAFHFHGFEVQLPGRNEWEIFTSCIVVQKDFNGYRYFAVSIPDGVNTITFEKYECSM